ncbi:MAG TPA: hypothetical protein VIC28_18830 [Thermoanaerobaculia bacterium]|jgi:hypothetical protein
MTYPAQPTPPPPGAPAQPPAKKGLGPLGWVLIGCGGIIVIGFLALGGVTWFAKKKIDQFAENPTFNAAKLVVKMNPELELVSADEKNSTLTIKNKKTGEVVTINAEDAKNGHIEFKTKDGTSVFDASGQKGTIKVTTDKGETATFGAGTPQNLPAWLPVYPGGTVQGTYDTTNAEGRTAAFSVTTKDAPDKVLDYYESQLKSAGLKVEKTTISANGQNGGTVTATSDDQKRQAGVMVGSSNEGTTATITFTDKK